MKYHVISPDGFTISYEPFASKQAALDAIPLWLRQYERQGYYLTGNLRKIPIEELPHYLRIVKA